MKKLKDLSIGFLVGILLFNSPAIANTIKTFIAEKATFPLVVDGNEVKLNNPIVTIEGNTYLPLRELGDILDVKVDWNTEKKQAEVYRGVDKVSENKYPYVTIEEKEYINMLDVHDICNKKRYILSWASDGLWYTLTYTTTPDLSREELLQEIGITEEETEDLGNDSLKRKYGLLIERAIENPKNPKTLEQHYITIIQEGIAMFHEYNKFPYMTREEFENVVLPFINK